MIPPAVKFAMRELGQRMDTENVLLQLYNSAREECANKVQALIGKDSGNWNRAIAYAVDAIRTAQPAASTEGG